MVFSRKKLILSLLITLLAAGLIWASRFYYLNLRGAGIAWKGAPVDIVELFENQPGAAVPATSDQEVSAPPAAVNSTGMPLKLPEGFSVAIFAKNLPGARVLAFDSAGNLWVSQTGEGKISRLDIKDGQLSGQSAVFTGLKQPHGLVFDADYPDILYVAEETELSTFKLQSGVPGRKQVQAALPGGGRHFTRTLLLAPSGLYVSIGSTCDVCHEKDERNAAIYRLAAHGSASFLPVAVGLRNSVFMAINPADGMIWATEMGRDFLGDKLPPDEINVIDPSRDNDSGPVNYGWPICYGQNIHDTAFDKKTYIRNPCQEPFELPSRIDLPAHSAPLGLAFVPFGSPWPREYWGNLLVALHGSWNSSVPVGYKVLRIVLDERGQAFRQEDFLSGWIQGRSSLGRPVDLKFDASGALYISDDKAGVIYKVTPPPAS